jgi:hypothetical protein
LARLVCAAALASTAHAQLNDYLGPGILTGGADGIGTRSGEQVDLRVFADVQGTYDNGLQPVSVDSKGNLIQVGGLYGIEAGLGAYGVHSWRVAQLGLDYRGDLRHYFQDSYYDSSNHTLTLGYTYQKSRRMYFDFRGIGGTFSTFLGGVPGETLTIPTIINTPSLLLFDNRTYFLEGSVGLTYLLTARTSFTVAGEGFTVQRQSKALVGVDGYGARARLQHRLSRTTSIGAGYDRQHYQYPNYYGNSDINMYTVSLATQLGRLWTLSVSGGAYQVNVVGLQSVSLDPAVAALLGVYSTVRTFKANNWIPTGRATLTRRFKDAALSFAYARIAVPGNGVYLTSSSENGSVSYNYTGVRKTSLAISGGYSSLESFGQGLAPYRSFNGGAGITYTLTHAFHAVARYDVRQQEIQLAGFRGTSYRVALGLAFSPGTLPLSLW